MNRQDNPTATEPREPYAILYLDCKAGSPQRVYGRSGTRYTFTPSDAVAKKPARVYYDPQIFEREEQDMRRNVKQLVAICTVVGSVNFAVRAESSVLQLIGSRQTLGAGKVRDALLRIKETVSVALEDIDRTVAVTQEPEPIISNEESGAGLAAADSQSQGLPIDKAGAASESSPTRLPYINAQSLHALEINKLRELVKARGGGPQLRSREAMVNFVIEEQTKAGVIA